MVTAAAFSPDGKMVSAGLFQGQVFLYEFDGLRYYTQLECRNRHGEHSRGKKVTGLAFLRSDIGRVGIGTGVGTLLSSQKSNSSGNMNHMATNTSNNNVNMNMGAGLSGTRSSLLSYVNYQMLVSTNDSRIRLYRLDNYSLDSKYKGLVNNQMQIKANFSEDGKYIISGSENGYAVIWNICSYQGSIAAISNNNQGETDSHPIMKSPSGTYGNKHTHSAGEHIRSCEMIDCSTSPVVATTVALFAPISSIMVAVQASDFVSLNGVQDIGSKIIITADYNGCMKVFVKGTFPGKSSE